MFNLEPQVAPPPTMLYHVLLVLDRKELNPNERLKLFVFDNINEYDEAYRHLRNTMAQDVDLALVKAESHIKLLNQLEKNGVIHALVTRRKDPKSQRKFIQLFESKAKYDIAVHDFFMTDDYKDSLEAIFVQKDMSIYTADALTDFLEMRDRKLNRNLIDTLQYLKNSGKEVTMNTISKF